MIEKLFDGVFFCSDDELRPLTNPDFDIERAYEEQEAQRQAGKDAYADQLRQESNESIIRGAYEKLRQDEREAQWKCEQEAFMRQAMEESMKERP